MKIGKIIFILINFALHFLIVYVAFFVLLYSFFNATNLQRFSIFFTSIIIFLNYYYLILRCIVRLKERVSIFKKIFYVMYIFHRASLLYYSIIALFIFSFIVAHFLGNLLTPVFIYTIAFFLFILGYMRCIVEDFILSIPEDTVLNILFSSFIFIIVIFIVSTLVLPTYSESKIGEYCDPYKLEDYATSQGYIPKDACMSIEKKCRGIFFCKSVTRNVW